MILVEQQLQLYFGGEYASIVAEATQFCNWIAFQPWFKQNQSMMINNEGGLQGMRLHALMSIIEYQGRYDRSRPDRDPNLSVAGPKDIGVGLKAYGRYLRSEYGSDKHQALSLDEDWAERYISHFRVEGREDPSSFVEEVPPSQERLYSQHETLDAKKVIMAGQSVSPPENKYFGDVLRYLTLTGQELEFFQYYTSVQDIREASALMGLSYKEGFRIYDRVKHRAARHNL